MTGRARRVRIGVLIGAAVLVVGALVAGEIYGLVTGCGSVDPTDPANYSVVTISNDTAAEVTVSDCHGAYCATEELPARLRPGQSRDDHAACGVDGNEMTSWRVTGSQGQVIGYIAVHTPRKRDDAVFHVSRASPDRRTPTPIG